MKKVLVSLIFLGVSLLLPAIDSTGSIIALWPAVCALLVIILTKHAALGLAAGVISGAICIHHDHPANALRAVFADFIFPSLDGPWHIGAILFTLILGAFAGLIEKSGGFNTILNRLVVKAKNPEKRLLGSIYGIGLLCFFDGLANSLLMGRIARPLVDRTGVSRERLAWVVDSTSSPVACIAFISTWIATQLSLIEQGLQQASFEVEPYGLFFQSIPANPYCLLTLLLVPLAIFINYQPNAMLRYPARPTEDHEHHAHHNAPAICVLLPLVALVVGIFAAFPLLSQPMTNPLSAAGWRQSFSGDAGPYALVAGSLFGLAVAWLMFPKNRTTSASQAAFQGAAHLLPALIILILAWSLGNVFSKIGAAEKIAEILSHGFSIQWLPLVVFISGALISFATGSSWGTMGLLMPLALPATLVAANAVQLAEGELMILIPAVIGAVFGGAVFGDHCSPFSDTTIVSAIASGCDPTKHVISQLPFAMLAAFFAAVSYAGMALGASAFLATLIAAALLTTYLFILKRKSAPVS